MSHFQNSCSRRREEADFRAVGWSNVRLVTSATTRLRHFHTRSQRIRLLTSAATTLREGSERAWMELPEVTIDRPMMVARLAAPEAGLRP